MVDLCILLVLIHVGI